MILHLRAPFRCFYFISYKIYLFLRVVTRHVLDMRKTSTLLRSPWNLIRQFLLETLNICSELNNFSIPDTQTSNLDYFISILRSFRHLCFKNNSYPLFQSKHIELTCKNESVKTTTQLFLAARQLLDLTSN